jgi:hypothetical protein
MKQSPEFKNFNAAMDNLLKADPKRVREQMESESRIHAEERKAKGEKKRGRKKAEGSK